MSSPCRCAGAIIARPIAVATKPHGGKMPASIQPSPPGLYGLRPIRCREVRTKRAMKASPRPWSAPMEKVLSIVSLWPDGAPMSRVEDGRGGCALKSPLRFPSPLIKPDVLISSIRLSDRRHRTTHGGRPLCARIRCETASSPNTSPKENREVPRLLTLCRLRRKFRTRS